MKTIHHNWKIPSLEDQQGVVLRTSARKNFDSGCFVFWWHCGLNSGPHLEQLHQPFFVKGLFKIGSQELFTQAGFEDPPGPLLGLLA
jgi:hypothetical protein